MVRPRAPSPPPKRTRRAPEEARATILDAAERVFTEHLPDVVGLKDVAREAGVSHALVTHYFGTYAKLVEATLERRFERMRASLVAEIVSVIASADTSAMLAAYRKTVASTAADPLTIRLATWAMLSGRSGEQDFFSHRVQGLRLLADALEARSGAPREDLEFALVASLGITVVWALGKKPLAGALGKKASAELDAQIEAKTKAMIEGYLRRARG